MSEEQDAWNDAAKFGTGASRGGERIDPADLYEPPELETLNLQDALRKQAIGSLEQQMTNALAFARSRNNTLALSPMWISSKLNEERLVHTLTFGHHYLELQPGQAPPAGWVVIA